MAGRIRFATHISPFQRILLTIVFGFIIGLGLAFVLYELSEILSVSDVHTHHLHPHFDRDDHADSSFVDVGPLKHHEHENENTTIQKKLYDEVRVLCWIMTNPKNHKSKAKHALNTWGKRCNKVLIMTSAVDDELDVVALPVQEGRNNLWAKTKEAFKYIYNNHFNDADWFLKADDDTYVVVENMRYMLHPYPPDYPIYFGCRFKPIVKPQGYMSGGAGYVISKEALKRFVEEALVDPKMCRSDNAGAEDAEFGRCMQNVHVVAGDSRDDQFRARFFPFVPEGHLVADPNHDWWYWRAIYYNITEGMECCSDTAVSFHYVNPELMYEIDFLVYHMRVFGRTWHKEPLKKRLNFMQMDERFKGK
ncbi:glycoprotein-N-acetylgalactosamine 3-beta-galactosyltransferase 1-like [Culicoides brevitarsis]|uniref:glycoprotein-N-acetylgalactosamine 3-beta-galactosyltransferase 1-like n=1 Tax=Culicoides brevitarsis TaxID=469753 RepID=UPI00307C58FD